MVKVSPDKSLLATGLVDTASLLDAAPLLTNSRGKDATRDKEVTVSPRSPRSPTFDFKRLAGNLIHLLHSLSTRVQDEPGRIEEVCELIKSSSEPFLVDTEDTETVCCSSTVANSFASTLSAPSSPTHPTEFDTDNFDFLALLGEGSYGSVFLASYAGQQVAVKALSKWSASDGQMEGILKERDLLRCLDHPFVLRLLGTCQTHDELWLVTEAQECGELWAAIHNSGEERAGLPHLLSQFYAACIILALDHIHAAGIIFRDLKPENVTIDSQGFPVIIDFGLARRLSPGEKCTTLVGTPDYFAPELVFGKEGYDTSVDIWVRNSSLSPPPPPSPLFSLSL